MVTIKRWTFELGSTLPFLVVATGLAIFSMPASADWYRFSDTAMTTPIELEFWTEDKKLADRVGEEVLAVFHQVDAQMSRYREDSEVSRLNRNAANGPVAVSDGLFEVLEKAREVSILSDGAFDITFGSVGYLYDFRAGKRPTEEELRSGLPQVNFRDVILDQDAQTVEFRQAGIRVDLGGIAKGYAVDLGTKRLVSLGIRHARLSAGGDMRLLGDKRGRPWYVGIRDPRVEGRNAVVLPLKDTAVSTSGDYERFFVDEAGDRVHHILSPETGKSVQGVQSVTIIGEDALTTDGLSTAVFVLGPARGLEMVERLAGIDVVVIDDQRMMHVSEGLVPPQSDQGGTSGPD
ncbi:FAD:protein FMN transferase [Marinobacter shengliensis]|uniref:FAD:protein FMN transferase n=1 Tax=Marinobacter shengliensis TaxID=1389223 RepID=UPI00268BA3B1